jgi:hypothetical protein
VHPIVVPATGARAAREALAAAPGGSALAPPRPDPALAAVAEALRGARARTGMNEHQVVAKLAEHGLVITVARLRGWERSGVIRVDAAARLADVYGITLDALSGRRAYGARRRAT